MGFLSPRPPLAIAGVFVLSFVVSLVLMWRARGPEAVESAAPPPASVDQPAAAQAPVPQTTVAKRAAPAWPGPVSLRPPPPLPPPPDAGPADETESAAPMPMPIGINVYNRRNRNRYEGYIQNVSNGPLSVTLEVVGADGRSHSSLQLDVPAGARQDFSSDAGLDLHSNDRIVVHSEHFQDLTVPVP